MDPQSKPEDAAKLFAEWMELRMNDLSAVMDDFIEKVVQSPDGFESADTNRFVTVGHSAGESAALGMARIRSDVVGVIALESLILAGLLDQMKSEVESEEQLKRLNTDCLDFLQRVSLSE